MEADDQVNIFVDCMLWGQEEQQELVQLDGVSQGERGVDAGGGDCGARSCRALEDFSFHLDRNEQPLAGVSRARDHLFHFVRRVLAALFQLECKGPA